MFRAELDVSALDPASDVGWFSNWHLEELVSGHMIDVLSLPVLQVDGGDEDGGLGLYQEPACVVLHKKVPTK